MTGTSPESASGNEEASGDEQVVVVRVLRDECLVSLDSSGELLHRRGYRLATAKAPLRETLAAALLMASEWDGVHPLIDPFSGSGTIPIEAALLARKIPPGLNRQFGFQHWRGYEPAKWEALVESARRGILPEAPATILGSDRDSGAVTAAKSNAERAGVMRDLALEKASVSSLKSPGPVGWMVTNPPYGTRVGERQRLRDLYASLGNILRRDFEGWHLTMLVAAGRAGTADGNRTPKRPRDEQWRDRCTSPVHPRCTRVALISRGPAVNLPRRRGVAYLESSRTPDGQIVKTAGGTAKPARFDRIRASSPRSRRDLRPGRPAAQRRPARLDEASLFSFWRSRMNNVKTFLLMGALMAIFLAAGQAIGGSQGLVMAFVMGSLINFGMFFFSDKLVLRMYGAKLVTEAEAPGALPDGGSAEAAGRTSHAEAGLGAARTAQCVRHRPRPATRRGGRDHRNPQVHASGRA